MEITVIRIDDRLIHGQIITKWIAEARAEQILVVDEKSAADPMLRMILALAVPSGIHLEVLSQEAALKHLRPADADDCPHAAGDAGHGPGRIGCESPGDHLGKYEL